MDGEIVIYDEVQFQKLSSRQSLRIELRKIAEVTLRSEDELVYLRVLGPRGVGREH